MSQGKVPSDWKIWTYNDYYRDSKLFAKALIKLGVQPFQIVNILGFNSVSVSKISKIRLLPAIVLQHFPSRAPHLSTYKSLCFSLSGSSLS